MKNSTLVVTPIVEKLHKHELLLGASIGERARKFNCNQVEKNSSVGVVNQNFFV
jgi:hypothetical protein